MNEEDHQISKRRPPPSITPDTLKKVMWLYRTRTCPLNKRGQCNYGVRCFDSHETQPERRAPKQNEYNDWHPSTMKCTSNTDESCKYGRACYFAHNDFEVNYHPTMFKTKLCTDFDKDGFCSLGMICPNYHYPDEQRKIEKGCLSADCKSDGISRKAPPPQEFRRWLDEELRLNKLNGIHIHGTDGTKPLRIHDHNKASNGHNQSVLHVNDNKAAINNNKQIKELQSSTVSNDGVNNVGNQQLKLNERDLHRSINTVNNGGNGIENEVEIELPSTQPSQGLNLSHSLIDDSPSARFVSPVASSPFVEHIDEKWHHQNMRYNNQSRPETYIPSVPTASPHLNRAMSTPQMEHDLPAPSRIQHAHSHHGTPSIASYRSNRSSNRSQKSGKSGRSSKSKSSGSKSKTKSKSSRKHSHKKKKESRKLEKKRNRDKTEKSAMDIISNYKVHRCTKAKCNDIDCINYHNLSDRRRSPLSYHYIAEACARIFDTKTRKFMDNCYGCPANENCEFAHNYLEIWYHPLAFHTQRCPLIKYQKNCPWGFKCSHYHKKSQKRRPQQMQQKYSPLSSSYSNPSNNQYGMNQMTHPGVQGVMHHGTPPNLQQHIVGPHRPPLTRNKQSPQIMSSEISSPYSASSFSPHSSHNMNNMVNMNNMNNLGMHQQHQHHQQPHHHHHQQQQQQNGLLSPHFDHINKSSQHNHQNDASYSYNPLMQGIAPSIHSWRQKIDKNVGY